jgi:hypothetical protein
MSYATLDGANIFGYATKMKMVQNPTAEQFSEFFGVDGLFSLYAGARGRHFMVRSHLFGTDMESLNAAETVFDTSQVGNIADGVARTLVTPRGVTYYNVIYRGEYEPSDEGPLLGVCPAGTGYLLQYNLMLHGLT